MPKRAGRPSVAQTPAPKSDKIYGSKKNPKGSATEKKSKSIKLSDKTIDTLKEKLDNFKKSHPNKKSVDLNDLKAVYRRGSGAYSKSHRPTITGGAPNSRAAWSYARVNKFLKKAGGAKVKAAYVQDDDLMADGGLTDGIELKITDSQDGKFKNFDLLDNGRVFGGVSISENWLDWASPDDKEWIKLKNNLIKIGVKNKNGEIVGKFYQVQNLYVGKGYNSKYKGKGYAKILMNEVIKYATKNDLLPLFLLAEPDKQEKMSRETLINFYKSFGFKYLGVGTMVYTSKEVEFNQESKYDYANGGVPKGGDCYEAAGQFCMGSVYMKEPVEFVGEPYLVHAEVKGQGKAEGIRFGHAWVEDDENVYDYSNGRQIVMPKVVYYAIGDVQTENPQKYQRYSFPDARAKMLETKHYGSWDIETEYADGGETEGYRVYVNDEYRRTIKDEDLKNYYLDKGFQMNNGKLQIYGNDIAFEDGGMPSQHITCINCGWEWETADSAEFDKYVCHQCGFDNSLFYDGGILKPTMTLAQIAEANLMKDYLKPVSIEYLEEQLNKGMQHEKEHTNSDEVAKTIALHHLAERPDYYEELEKMKLENGGEVDLFEDIDSLPENVQAVLAKYAGADESYTNAEEMLAELEPLGYTFEYGLDALPFNLTKIDILEDNRPEEYEIADFLNQQKAEAQMVMTCDDSKIYKAMICKTKCEIADKRMSETENPEELNAWNSYKNIWNECLESIVNDDMDKYNIGGKTCGCGCGSIYSKGGMFSKGGLAYGNSHDKGGMPMKVKSTGQNIEIEGGEGVINKRSMQSTKKVEFQGQKMTPCEAVSKINQMGGGVKFKCEEVADIIAEDGNF